MHESVVRRYRRIWRAKRYFTHHPKQRGAHILVNIGIGTSVFGLVVDLLDGSPDVSVFSACVFAFTIGVKLTIRRISRRMRRYELAQDEWRES